MELTYEDYCWDEYGRGFRQRELACRVAYDHKYLDKYREIDDQVWMLSARRLAVLEAFVPSRGRLLDFGCGTGRFVQLANNQGWQASGYDLVSGPGRCDSTPELRKWDVATFFDSLEHLTAPDSAIRALRAKTVMISVPWCHFPDDPDWFMNYYHRRPGEHLWSWNRDSLISLLDILGYRCKLTSNFEDDFRATHHRGLENILSGIFEKRT